MFSIKGIKTTLEEITVLDAADIVKLRNDPANNKFLFQKEITIQDQIDWINKYMHNADVKNFKVINNENEFKGTISIYNIIDKKGEFGRYIVTNPINAIEAEYLLLKICFERLGLDTIYCQTNHENIAVWGQHTKLGFRETAKIDVNVGSNADVLVKAIVQEITAKEFKTFNYEKILNLIKSF
jgi:RimJ/RimL family protein N-acetyltransferase